MSSNSPLKEHNNDKNIMPLTQIIILNKPKKKSKEKNKKSNKENIPLPLDISFKLNKFAFFNVKKKSKINFGQGKIYLKTAMDKDNCINLAFYDSSSCLRFQGFINTKKSSFVVDINNKNCVKINEIIGLIFYLDDEGQSKYDIIVTNIFIYFQEKEDLNEFFDSLN